MKSGEKLAEFLRGAIPAEVAEALAKAEKEKEAEEKAKLEVVKDENH